MCPFKTFIMFSNTCMCVIDVLRKKSNSFFLFIFFLFLFIVIVIVVVIIIVIIIIIICLPSDTLSYPRQRCLQQHCCENKKSIMKDVRIIGLKRPILVLTFWCRNYSFKF